MSDDGATQQGTDLALDLPQGNARLEHDDEKGQFLLTVEGSRFRYILPDHSVQAWLSILTGCYKRLERIS